MILNAYETWGLKNINFINVTDTCRRKTGLKLDNFILFFIHRNKRNNKGIYYVINCIFILAQILKLNT